MRALGGVGIASAIVALAVAMIDCGHPKTDSCSPASFRDSCGDSPNGAGCRAARMLDSNDFGAALAEQLSGAPAALDAALVELFSLEGTVLTDEEPSLSPGFVFTRPGFSDFPVKAPIDWRAGPDQSETFRFWFQNLSWLSSFGRGADFAQSIESGAAVVLAYQREVLAASPPLEMTWNDHAIAIRLERVSAFADRYIAGSKTLSRPVLVAIARILLSHLEALATPGCYTSRHNHGAAQDVAILETTRKFSVIKDADELRELALSRLLLQLRSAMSSDGIHLENSPGYQVYFSELVTRGAAALTDQRSPTVTSLRVARDALLDGMVYMLQPNLTFPQFGETENRNVRKQLDRLLGWVSDEGREPSESAARLRWIITRGAKGAAPGALDRVFTDGGFAAFRSSWAPDAITAHMTCGFKSAVHYQPDEGSFELAAAERELIVDSGVFTYGAGRFADYQNHPRGQNVMVVNRADYRPRAEPTIALLESSAGVASAICRHSSYAGEGVDGQRRTMTFERRGRLIISDELTATRPARFAQHLTLHPSLDEVVIDEGGRVRASMSAGGPSLTITPRGKVVTTVSRGFDSGDGPVSGWWFERINSALPASHIVFDYGEERGAQAFVLEIEISAPQRGGAR